MKVCLINNLYKPYARGGAERVVETIAEGFKTAGHEVFVIATRPVFINVRCQMSDVRCFFIPALYYNLGKLPVFLRLFWHVADMFDIGSFLKVRAILKKIKPDMVMTHNLKGIGYLIPMLIKFLRIKHIHTLHDIQLLHPSGLIIYGEEKKVASLSAKIYQFFCRLLFGSPDAVISPSKWFLKMYEERGFFKESKKEVMPNPMFLASPCYPPGRTCTTNAGHANFSFRFLYVGQIEEHKGILFLIKIFKKVVSTHVRSLQNMELFIVGDGSKMEEIKRIAAGNENIKFLGRKNKEEILEIMRQSNCLVVPSLCYENSPTVIYEAFAAGLPVIGANLGGIPELLGEGRGILFKPGDENDLVEKMRWAAENEDQIKKITLNGRQILENFKLENYIDRVLNI